jgi:hypothetical protein
MFERGRFLCFTFKFVHQNVNLVVHSVTFTTSVLFTVILEATPCIVIGRHVSGEVT